MIGSTFILDYSLIIVNTKVDFFLKTGGDKVLGAKIESLCKERNISIAKVEKDCAIGNATIRKWDKSHPRIDTLKKVAAYFGKPIEYFLE